MGLIPWMQGHGVDSLDARSWVWFPGCKVMGLIPRMQDNGFDFQDFHCIQGCTLDAIKVALNKVHYFKCKYILCSLCYRTAKWKPGPLKPPGSTPRIPIPCPIPALPSTRWPSLLANGAIPCKCCSLQCGQQPMIALHPPGSPPASHSHNNNNSNSSSRFPSTRSWTKASKPSRSNPSIDPRTCTSTELDLCW